MVRGRYGYSFWVFVFFCEFVKGLVELYPELYDADNAGNTSNLQVNFGNKWKSYTTIIELANNDIRAIDQVIQEPLEKCLLFLSYRADKIFLENMLHKEALKGIK